VVLFVRRLGGRLVRQCEDNGAAIGLAVETHPLARLHVRVEPFAIAPQRLLAIHYRPAQTARLMVLIERRQIVTMATAEAGVLLEQPLLDVKTEGLGLVIELALALLFGELIDLTVG